MHHRRVLVFSLLIFLPWTAFAQIQQIDTLVTNLFEDHMLNGNVAISDRGQVVYQKSFGIADAQRNIPNQADTRFQIASIGKLFTATAILQLKEKKLLRLDDAVCKFLPAFPFPIVTIRQLLSHTSGLPDLQILEPLAREQPNRVVDNSLVIDALKRHGKLEFEPGEKWRYSNPGYCVLALIVEKVTRQKFADYLTEHIWKPASMNNTYPYSAALIKPDPLRAESYRMPIFSFQLQKVDTMNRYKSVLINFGGLEGLGFIASTTADLLSFDRALDAGILLKASTLKEAYEPQKLKSGEAAVVEPGKLTFGLGWFISTDSTRGRIVSHSGFIPGGSTILLRNIAKRQAVVILDNAESDGIHQTGEAITAMLVGASVRTPKRSVTKLYANDLLFLGTDYAAAHLQQIRPDTSNYRFSAGEMDYCARELNAAGYKIQALETSKLLTFIDPGAWQTYNSYGELLLSNGKVKEAAIMFRKSLEIFPDNHFAKQALTNLKSE
ncbi:MAG: hypothetical protein BGO21_07730 [Dyadobacter sp. 50-39]|uniref:serine hydrolase domain-containing protein n=1 Tax=Dyadobacter sp. 50-39 TaxID=1895756 RepID=UPI00095E7568|nr:MAG: hypothetical protein BGO21_07730 [Dyadobacter sp. 50-39]